VLPFVDTERDTSNENTLHAPINVAGAEIGKLYISDTQDRKWTPAEADIMHNTSMQLSRHIENLRLLAQAEKYRRDAEEATKRLTREGWETYLNLRKENASGFMYRENKVQPLDEKNVGKTAHSLPIQVRDETIGEFAVEAGYALSEDATEILTAVARQLSSHLESLRLLEEAETSRVEVGKSQEQYSLAVSGSNDGIWDWDIANNTIYYSPRWKGMLGYEEHELTRGFVEWEDLIHPEDRNRATKALEDYIEQRASEYDVEVRLRHKDGTWRWIRDRGKALRRPDGTAYRMAGSHSDITERKLNEELIAQRANQLETVATVSTTASTVLNPDELLQTVVDLTKVRFGLYHAHIYLADETWNTLLLAAGAGDVGRAMTSTGHNIQTDTPHSLVARAYRERQPVIVNDVHQTKDFLPNPLLPDTHAEMAIPMIAGERVIGVFDAQSEQAGFFTEDDALIFNTLASQVAIALQNARLYQEQAATLTQLRELDRLKSSFLANMSHELRTPLNSILGFTDVMLEGLDGELTPYMDNDLRLIQKNGQHLLHLINDVLDMAKIESGRMNLHPEKFRVHSILDEVTSITSTLASEKNIALFIEPDSDHELEIYADNTRLRQVMINLVNNAIKFTGIGKIALNATRLDDARVLISVKDTGIGIPPDKLETVFLEFTQVDTSTTRKAGGTGLGLPISRRLVDMHGGRLWAESTGIEGEGSTFFVELPLEARITDVIEKQEK
jgi:PAS domain S-box-containing protein